MNAPAYSASSLSLSFAESLRALGPFSKVPHIAIALSGGPDSMALALLAAEWMQQHGGTITTLTVDHGLRPDSEEEAQQVARWMKQRGIAHHILTPPHTAESNNLLEVARTWRYDALAAWCKKNNVLHCLLAHHADDERETIAINTTRGDTEDGDSGMVSVRNYRGVRFLRPLLFATKSALLAHLQTQKAPWVEDPTNRDMKFARARLRTQTLTAHKAAAARTKRDHALADAAMRCVTMSPLGYATLDLADWKKLEPLLRSQLLADLLTAIAGATRRPRKHETERLVQALLEKPSRHTLHGCLLELKKKLLHIECEPARVAKPVTLSGKGTLRWDDRFVVHYDLKTPCTLGPLSQKGKKSLETDVPIATPALWRLDEVLFVPHIHKAAHWPHGCVHIGFAPAKPLAAAPFW